MNILLRRRIVSVGLGELRFGSGRLAGAGISLLRLHLELSDGPVNVGRPIDAADAKEGPANSKGSAPVEFSTTRRAGFR